MYMRPTYYLMRAAKNVGQLIFDLFPPLTPPLAADEDAQLGMPAVGNLLIDVRIVEAVVTALVAVGLTAQDRIFREVAQLNRQLLVDLFGLGFGERNFFAVVGSFGHESLLCARKILLGNDVEVHQHSAL